MLTLDLQCTQCRRFRTEHPTIHSHRDIGCPTASFSFHFFFQAAYSHMQNRCLVFRRRKCSVLGLYSTPMLGTYFIQLVPGAVYSEKHGVARRIHSSGTQLFSKFSLRETRLQREFLRSWSCCQSFRRRVERHEHVTQTAGDLPIGRARCLNQWLEKSKHTGQTCPGMAVCRMLFYWHRMAECGYMAQQNSSPQHQHQSFISSETCKRAYSEPYYPLKILESHHQRCV